MVQDIAYGYLAAGEYGQALLWVFNIYIPYDIFWLMLGILIFGIINTKSQGSPLAISTMIFYFIGVAGLMTWFGVGSAYLNVINGVLLVILLYTFFIAWKAYKGSGY
jgi:hypothetical protein